MKLSTLLVSALVAIGGTQSWAQTNKLATVGIVTGTVTVTDRVGTPTNRPGTVGNNLAGLAYVAGNVPGAVDTSISFFTLTGATLPPNPADTFTSYGTLISPTAVGSYPDVAALATANSYSGLTFAIDDLGLPIAGTFYMIHHKNSGDYFANIVPRTGGLSSTSDLKPMSWQGGVAGGPSDPGATGYFGLAYATGAVTGYAANSMFYLRTDGASHTQFGVMIPALTGASTDKIDLTNAVGSFGVGGYTTLAYSPVAFGGYAANQFYYLRLDSVTGNTILGRLDPSLVLGTRTISDIANLGGVFNTLNYAFDATGPSGSWGLSQLYATGGRSATAQSISFAAIADKSVGVSFTVTPSASSGLALTLSVVSTSTGAASITGPVAGVFTVKPLAPGIITLEAKQSGGAFDTNLLRQSFNATGTAVLAITTQPTSQSAVTGATANFSVSASGTSTVSYQWRKAGTNIGGGNASATTSTLTLPNVQAGDAASYDVVVTNLSGSLTSNSVTLTVSAPAPVITNSPLTAGGTVSSAFSFGITASGSPTSFSAAPLPAGLTVNTSTGVISGTPTTAGSTSVVLGATNGSGTGNATLTVTISAAGVAPVITNNPLTAGGTVNTAFSFAITASGSPTSFSAAPLPAGLTVNTSTGVISGTPTAAGSTSVVLGATNGTGTGNATLTVTISAAGVAPVITNNPLTAGGTVSTAFGFTITASGSPTSFSAAPLPAGLTVSTTTGVISGTPTTAGSTAVVIGATNGTGTGTATLNITVVAAGSAPVVNNSPLTAAGTIGTPFSFAITAAGSPTSYSASPLPAGLSVVASTGVITGTPTTAGITSVLLGATNGTGTGNATLTVTVAAAGAKPVITISPFTAGGTVGTPFSFQVTATGSPTRFAANVLPPGLIMNTVTGVISGTPTTDGVTAVLLSATNSFGTGRTSDLTITIGRANAVPAITNTVLAAAGTIGTPFSYTITASGSPTSYTASPLPAGLSIVAATGVITGTPTTAGTTVVVLTATNSLGTTTGSVTITVAAATVAPVITSPTTAPGTVGTQIVPYVIVATGTPTSYAATGLPPGLTVDSSTGVISGTPTTAGTYVVTITATNSAGTTTTTVTMNVGPNLSSRILNFSARALSGPGDQTLIMGFVVSGDNKHLLVRGIGPTLANFGLTNVLADPMLTLYNSTTAVATNDDWSIDSSGQSQSALVAATAAQVGAFALPAGSKDSALLFTVNNGAHTTGLLRPNSTSGVALTEIYDTDSAVGARLINVSARMNVTPGEGTLIAGFVIGGTVSKTVLIRGIGPTLAAFNVGGVLADPQIAVYSGSTVVASNDDWSTGTSTAAQIVSASAQVGAFALPAGSKDAAVLVTLQPGTYTVVVTGVGNTAGVALVEIYDTQ